MDAGVEHAEQQLDRLRRDAGAAVREHLGAHQHGGAHQRGGMRRAERHRVTAHQVALERLALRRVDALPGERPAAGGETVDGRVGRRERCRNA